MVRTQVQLEERQIKALRRLSFDRNESISEIIRTGVDLVICSSLKTRDSSLVERAKKASGILKSGTPDLSENHDKHLSEIYG